MNKELYLSSIGKEKSYFDVIKHRKKLFYRYLIFLGKGDIVNGHIKYIKLSYKYKQEIIDIRYKFQSDKEFSSWLCLNKIFTHSGNALSFVSVGIYNLDVMTILKFKLYREIIKKFNLKGIAWK